MPELSAWKRFDG
ncbi:Protein of unknown function [Propionibacterium freudenreichii]|nr:Protein of unknown function [Propionibacterium freudenreichii]CEG99914.1 Protein of unknown function [Propionibacterium freudenreichii]CEH02742.1 Protein of unknown function [Propionibacterium freudenreichii]CEH10886.1 Protein of unknown function [Propionibacterium freudenreichii]